MSKIEKCEQCEKIRGTKEQHPCPLEEAVNSKSENHCNCCSKCKRKCKKDIISVVDSIYEAHRLANIGDMW